MALKLDDVKLKPTGALKSLLDLILERREEGEAIRKKRVLRPWESFSDLKKDRNFEVKRKKGNIMKPFVKDVQLSDEQKMAKIIKKRAIELFSDLK